MNLNGFQYRRQTPQDLVIYICKEKELREKRRWS